MVHRGTVEAAAQREQSLPSPVAQVGQLAPTFQLPAVIINNDDEVVCSNSDFAHRWLILLFYPRDFSFVCPTELTAFSARLEDFQQRQCDILGVSVDTLATHREWLATPTEEGGLGPLRYPLASDFQGKLARQFGIWDEQAGVALRGLFIIDPAGVVQYSVVQNLSVGRNSDETLRVLDALQAGGLCPAGWTRADGQLDPESLLRRGTALGHYRIVQQIGMGSFGQVFEAWDTRLERSVALKILHANGVEARQFALQEARAAARLNHPNVCTIYAVEEEDGLSLITMELLAGETLAQRLSQGPIPPKDALPLMIGLAAGMNAAHQEKIPHGDLKPANIFVLPDGQPKILDFGLARPTQQNTIKQRFPGMENGKFEDANATLIYTPDSHGAEDHGTISGTPAYMSPEHANGLKTGPASDVFALGLIFCEIITGQRVLADSSPVAVLLRLQSVDLAKTLTTELTSPWEKVILPMLARAAADRPTMQQVVDLLKEIDPAQ